MNELIDLNIPNRGTTAKPGQAVKFADNLERQLDRLIDMLAFDQDVETKELPVSNPPKNVESLELSIVMPCLDEADTVGSCVLKARSALEQLGVPSEIIVADNGSRDDSVEIAEALGARVVHVDERGYGAALMAGIAAARGRFIIMGDADDSYDFTQVPKFYERLCEGADLVQGCRLPAGGGRIMPGAMPWLHHFGNPALTWLVRKMFQAPINDVYCGMRGFRKDLYKRLDQRCTGMEFATEMIIKSTLFGARISEIPITLHPDGRRSHRPHLRTFRDGWKTLRFFLLQCPRWTFMAPAALMATIGMLGYLFVLARLGFSGIAFDAHTLLASTCALLVAAQVASCGVLAKTFAGFEGLLPRDEMLESWSKVITLERCLMCSALLMSGGVGVIGWKASTWMNSGFGELDYSSTMRFLIPAVGAIALGVQVASSSFLLSVLRLRRR